MLKMATPTRSILRNTLLVFLLACCCDRFSWAATVMPTGAVLKDMCDHSLACSVIDESWPKNNTFSCGSKIVSATAFATATEAFTMGEPRAIQDGVSWPASASGSCTDQGPDYSKHSYSNGQWTVYYTIRSICECKDLTGNPKAMPMCRSATSQDDFACNRAIFKFCSMEMDGTTCSR
ncbi:hypothetical protein Pst134EA_005127 [Puccinia striiformis f. sp. tritici]|uniref:hypothetical protein n=1 Tax=Puccinia striiformis f. sp. tritici TaxID=168172 RepID=UPI0020072EBF|nr:hypothetical protein Pst134EA_005127 [Puccinia striiformis f. sp. tritici]KAH9462284.1 hypothetical protein Pst134EB_006190 [Puccinia striiformis f. sp. tritici]KAH9471219.1 hypothetical protein Pst134EA_005127 [Puccinia striiformis f. sp. tritici]KAI9619949.1 hypothetical protein H4Q26_013930 [Puccinia striiformis f. sp. tritici PST-130]KAI9629461.1 hypothetical protein KEM48_012930 [Puccinia striiformis f. sp. tritici PST-130]